MARYVVEAATKLQPLQAGDYPQPIGFIVPDSLSMTSRGAVFTMEDHDGVEIIKKDSTVPGEIEIVDQVITVLLAENDTKDRTGIFDWVLRITGTNELITVGYGSIQINQIG